MTEAQAQQRAKSYAKAIENIELAVLEYERDTNEIVSNISIYLLDISTMESPGNQLRTITLAAYLPDRASPESDSAP